MDTLDHWLWNCPISYRNSRLSREVAPQSGSIEPLVDWSAELETIAEEEAPALLAERLQKCREAETHGRFLVGCGKVIRDGTISLIRIYVVLYICAG